MFQRVPQGHATYVQHGGGQAETVFNPRGDGGNIHAGFVVQHGRPAFGEIVGQLALAHEHIAHKTLATRFRMASREFRTADSQP